VVAVREKPAQREEKELCRKTLKAQPQEEK
jgi:hypothetical protein